MAALVTPSLSAFAGRSPGAGVGICLGISFIWLIPVFGHAIDLGQLVCCVLVLTSLVAAAWSLTRLEIPPAITIVALIAWLAWPVWLSPSLNRVHLLVLFHPLFAINHIVDNLGIWTEQQSAYGLTSLGQDVQYQLPASPWPAILFHFGVAMLALFTSTFIAPRSMNQIDADASAVKSK